ncbi:CU044_2847 family protein [Streptomyces sp. NPDC093982]|uniref:CU044_2847 family protein n=1 Tax=Streptomyces sp. NPDC093982 TaxID=3155077 RepID=UPI0034214CD6
MATTTTYRNFSDVPGLRVEVEDAAGAAGDPSLAGLLDGVRALVVQAAARLGQLPPDQRPTELSLTFGLRAVNDGFAVGLDSERANFRVSLAWTQEPPAPEQEIPGFPGT